MSTTVPLASGGRYVPKLLSKKEKAGQVSLAKGQNPQKNKKKGEETKKKKRKARTMYRTFDMKDAEMFSLCDAMRYVPSVSI